MVRTISAFSVLNLPMIEAARDNAIDDGIDEISAEGIGDNCCAIGSGDVPLLPASEKKTATRGSRVRKPK